MIKKVNIIGSGNVATHLANHLSAHVEIKTIYSRTFINARSLAVQLNTTPVDDPEELSDDADLNILSLKDDAVEGVLNRINKNIPIVHTSGSIDINVFKGFNDFGILYPLQTFSKSRSVDVNKIPLFLEASSPEFYTTLEEFCHQYISYNTGPADSNKRAGMHLAAVIANNFSNYLLTVSSEILSRIDLPLETIEPLMQETFNKAFLNGPENSQTGPGKRGDIETIKKHIEMLSDEDNKKLYRMMSDFILKKYNS